MNKFWSFVLVLLLVGCASVEIKDHSAVVALPGQAKKTIYQKAMQWITYKFVSGRAVMDYKDPETGRIIAKGVLLMSRVEVHMIATIDCIDGKSRIKVEQGECAYVDPNGNRLPCNGAYLWPEQMKKLANLPEQFTKEYNDYMTGGAAPVWDGK